MADGIDTVLKIWLNPETAFGSWDLKKACKMMISVWNISTGTINLTITLRINVMYLYTSTAMGLEGWCNAWHSLRIPIGN